jgi:Na+/H+ antiporter NhaD/arsenite permease-like protein
MHESALRQTIALAVFAASYVGLGLGRLPVFRVDRTGVAIIGGALMVLTGVLPWNDAVLAVDAHTLVLLFGMMIVAAYLRLSGFFSLVALWTIRKAKTPRSLLAAVIAAVALATAANVGSVATLTGNPQNMLVGSFSSVSYRGFLLREGPIALLGLVCVFVVVGLVYRRELPDALTVETGTDRVPVHYPLMLKTVAAVCVMLIAFLVGVPIALVAIGGAAYSLFTRRVNPEKVYREVNWQLLVLFVGLFVLTGGIERAGLVDDLVGWAGAAGLHRPAILTVTTAVLSNLVSNVPAVLLLKPLIPSFGEPDRGWLILAMASTLAGNLTILGSVANLIVVEVARESRVRIGFLEYCRVGIPLTVLTLLLGWLILIAVPV